MKWIITNHQSNRPHITDEGRSEVVRSIVFSIEATGQGYTNLPFDPVFSMLSVRGIKRWKRGRGL